MADVFSKKKRSQIMSQVKSRDTVPEISVRKMVHGLGFRFRKKEYALPGKPDIVLPKYKTAIYVHGCFWHQHSECRGKRIPKSRVSYWKPKLERNVQRDKKNIKDIRSLGWRTLIIWECSLQDANAVLVLLRKFLGNAKGLI